MTKFFFFVQEILKEDCTEKNCHIDDILPCVLEKYPFKERWIAVRIRGRLSSRDDA